MDKEKMTSLRLSQQNLEHLALGVTPPLYDRRLLSVGIVPFGLAGFHRTDQAMVLDDLMAQAPKDLVG